MIAMPRYIDADALEKVLQKRSDELFDEHFPKMSGALMGVICYVISAPTVDAVPVVRCGECKFFHFHPNDDFADNAGVCTENSHYCDFSKCEADRFITDFCSYGKRKDGEK